MLELFNAETFRIAEHKDIIFNVEEAFDTIRLQNDEITCMLLKYIEKAEYYDASRIIDRFGTCIYTSEISTGCKAALCVHYLKDKIIDLKESGVNARDYIVFLCNEGRALFYFPDLTINQCLFPKKCIEVSMDGRYFNNVVDLNRYLQQKEDV